MESGRQQLIEELYRRYANDVHAYACRRSDVDVADDVVMEVFVVACRRIDDVPERALPWLLGCARRVLANHRRGAGRAQALVDRLSAIAQVAGVDATEAGVLAAALAELSDRDRELLLLTAWEGLGLGEAAEVVGCSRGAAGVRLHRSRKRLRQIVAGSALTRADHQRPEVAR